MGTKLFTPNRIILSWRHIRLINENAENVGRLRRYLKENRSEILNALGNLDDSDMVYFTEYNHLWCLGLRPDLKINMKELKKCPECGKTLKSFNVASNKIVKCHNCGLCAVVNQKRN